jgi:hypothetical protein
VPVRPSKAMMKAQNIRGLLNKVVCIKVSEEFEPGAVDLKGVIGGKS